MGKLREAKRQPPWNGTKKQGRAWASERALKNRIHELEQQLQRSESEKREQASTIAKLNEELRGFRAGYDQQVARGAYRQEDVERLLRDQRVSITIRVLRALVEELP